MKLIYKLKSLFSEKNMRNGFLFASFSFLNKGFGFLLLLILASFITPAEYGYLSLYTTVQMVVSYFIALSAEGYMEVAYFHDNENGIKKTFSCIFFISLLFLILFLLIISLDISVINEFLELKNSMLYMCVCTSFFLVFNNLILSLFRVKGKIVEYGVVSCGAAFLNFVISIFLVKFCALGWLGRVYAQLSCAILFGIFSLIYFLRKGYLSFKVGSFFKPLLLWSIPLIPHLATNFIKSGCDRYIINNSHSVSDVGIFSFALTLANIIIMIGAGFNQSNSVDIYKILGDNKLSNTEKYERQLVKIRNYTVVYSTIAILTTVIIAVFTPIVLPQYIKSIPLFIILSIYGLLACLYFVYTNYLFFYGKTKNIMYVTLSSALIHLMFSLIFTRYSLYITAFIYVLTQAIVVFVIRRYALSTLNSKLN